MEQDPAGDANGANLYQFVESCPTVLVDPTRLDDNWSLTVDLQPQSAPRDVPFGYADIPGNTNAGASVYPAETFSTFSVTHRLRKLENRDDCWVADFTISGQFFIVLDHFVKFLPHAKERFAETWAHEQGHVAADGLAVRRVAYRYNQILKDTPPAHHEEAERQAQYLQDLIQADLDAIKSRPAHQEKGKPLDDSMRPYRFQDTKPGHPQGAPPEMSKPEALPDWVKQSLRDEEKLFPSTPQPR